MGFLMMNLLGKISYSWTGFYPITRVLYRRNWYATSLFSTHSKTSFQFKQEIIDEQQMEKLGRTFCEFLEIGDTILLRGNLQILVFLSVVIHLL